MKVRVKADDVDRTSIEHCLTAPLNSRFLIGGHVSSRGSERQSVIDLVLRLIPLPIGHDHVKSRVEKQLKTAISGQFRNQDAGIGSDDRSTDGLLRSKMSASSFSVIPVSSRICWMVLLN